MNWDLTSHFFSQHWNQSTAIVGGTSYNCIPLELAMDKKYQEGGLLADAQKILLFKAADVTPAVDSEVTFGGTIYKVLNYDTDSAGKVNKVYLGARYG